MDWVEICWLIIVFLLGLLATEATTTTPRSTPADNSKGPIPEVDFSQDEERVFKELKVDMYKSIYKENKSLKKKIEHILGVYEHGKYTTMEMPTDLTMKDMNYLLQVCDEEKELNRTLKFFYTRECTRYNSRRKKLKAKLERAKVRNPHDDWSYGVFDENNEIAYGLWKNSIVNRVTKQSVRDYRQNHLLRSAALFGQKLLIDLDYDQYMKIYESKLLAVQIALLYYTNRTNREFPEALPFDIHFVNCHKSTTTFAALGKQIMRFDRMSPYLHHRSYMEMPELFPKERLVYMSPHASEPLRHYNHDDIFILGAYNDRTTHSHVSHLKAATEGIRCYRLPLDENVLWKQGNKNLCLNQVADILHAVKATNDWRLAVQRFSPQRKIKSIEEIELEDEIRIKKVARRLKSIAKSHS